MAKKDTASASAAATLSGGDEAATRDYVVVKGRLVKGSDAYDAGATVALTDAEAEHPLATGAVRLKDAE